MDWYALTKKKVDDLREMAKEIPEMGAVTGMQKQELIEAVAAHRGIEAPRKVVVGIDKAAIKSEIKTLRKERDVALGSKDLAGGKKARLEIRKRKRKLRKAMRVS